MGNLPPKGDVGIVGSSPEPGTLAGDQLPAVPQSVLTFPVQVLAALFADEMYIIAKSIVNTTVVKFNFILYLFILIPKTLQKIIFSTNHCWQPVYQ
jgi:hypothetical protein